MLLRRPACGTSAPSPIASGPATARHRPVSPYAFRSVPYFMDVSASLVAIRRFTTCCRAERVVYRREATCWKDRSCRIGVLRHIPRLRGAGFVAYRRQKRSHPARVSHIAGRRASSSGAMSYIAESRQRGKPRRGTCSVSSGSLHSSAPHRRRNSKPQAVRPDVQRGCGRACGASSLRRVLRVVSPSILGDAEGALQHVLDVEDDLA